MFDRRKRLLRNGSREMSRLNRLKHNGAHVFFFLCSKSVLNYLM